MKKSVALNACQLKVIAVAAMLVDHVGFCFNLLPLRIVGRLAFPIFLFLIVNGYRHTASPLRYALRLGISALISQVPFSLFAYNSLWSGNGNVFFTLLMALLCIWVADAMGRRRVLKSFRLVPAVAIFCLYHFGILRSDYGAKAILAAMVFYLFPERKGLITVGYLAAVFYGSILSLVLGLLRADANPFPTVSQWEWIQAFSAFALPLIFRYNGQKGAANAKAVQYGFYLFYPVHLLILWLIF